MFPSGPTVGPAITPCPFVGSTNVHRIVPSGATAVMRSPLPT